MAAAGFEVAPEMFLQLMSPAVLAIPGVRCYVGEADGQPVTTGLGIKLGSNVAIFNISTPPSIAGAVTARPSRLVPWPMVSPRGRNGPGSNPAQRATRYTSA